MLLLLLLLLLLSVLRIVSVIPLLLGRFVTPTPGRRSSSGLDGRSTDVPRCRGEGRIVVIRSRSVVLLIYRSARGRARIPLRWEVRATASETATTITSQQTVSPHRSKPQTQTRTHSP